MVEKNSMLGVKRASTKLFEPQEMNHRFGAKSDFVQNF